MNLIIIIGFFYIILGLFSLLIPLLYIELERPKDFIKAGINLILGILLIIYKNIFTNLVSLIIFLNAILMFFYIFENFSYRWNQLLEKEKFELKSLNKFKNNFSIILKIISASLKNLFLSGQINNKSEDKLNKKKWVRKNDNSLKIISDNESSEDIISNIQPTNLPKEDIIGKEKNETKKNKFDKK
tara:strand:- start:289 stop:846 length:558 start_codon:yes stop_codon:yes gene_type:complete